MFEVFYFNRKPVPINLTFTLHLKIKAKLSRVIVRLTANSVSFVSQSPKLKFNFKIMKNAEAFRSKLCQRKQQQSIYKPPLIAT